MLATVCVMLVAGTQPVSALTLLMSGSSTFSSYARRREGSVRVVMATRDCARAVASRSAMLMALPLPTLYACPGAPRSASAMTAAAESDASVMSRAVAMLPCSSTGGCRPTSAMAICLQN